MALRASCERSSGCAWTGIQACLWFCCCAFDDCCSRFCRRHDCNWFFWQIFSQFLWLPSPAHSNLQLDFKVVLLLAHSSDHIFELPNQLKNNTREKLSTQIHMIWHNSYTTKNSNVETGGSQWQHNIIWGFNNILIPKHPLHTQNMYDHWSGVVVLLVPAFEDIFEDVLEGKVFRIYCFNYLIYQ